ncbi:sel1 repeat family protein [Aureimonas psammosilenae]|uniref:sel1 repeat family protein n=1 Tax=Aureimonas psammosilenae TaxID=2495496 RepID=UPI0012613370|nr:sel1 repeat family protein [Aureimonas psammosilenae]
MARFELSELSNGGIGATVHSSAEILFEMGVRAASGRDGAVDLVSAHMYFNLADREGDERAAFHRHEVAEQMSKIEIGRALRAARDWLAVH